MDAMADLVSTQLRLVAELQQAAYHRAVLRLMELAAKYGAPVGDIREAIVGITGPIPEQPQGPGHTESLETDDPPVDSPEGMERAALEKRWDDVEAIRRADEGTEGGRPTLRLETVGGGS